jgi:6-phosphogluconate dehydrogenase
MEDGFDLGLLGLDVLSGNFARSMAGHDLSVAICAGSAIAAETLDDFLACGIEIVTNIEQLVGKLKEPRALLFRGPQPQSAFGDILDLLEVGDIIIDASDSWFRDTNVRARLAAAKGVQYLALGLGLNENASCPLLMPGGRPEAFDRASAFFEAAAPRAYGSRATGYLGGGPAGHFVQMTHAAVDNAVLEIVREVQTLLERGLNAEAGDFLRAKSDDALFDYLRRPVGPPAAESGREMGRWAVRAGRELEIPMLTIEAASGVRSWENREALAEPFCQPHGVLRNDTESLVAQAHGALCVATIIAYTEGLALMATASERLGFHLDILETVRVWRSGASLRGRLLEDIQTAFTTTPGLPNLLFDDDFSEKVMELQEFLRHSVGQADEWNIPTPTLTAALRYIDTFRDAWLPINLVQPDDFHWTPRSPRAFADTPFYADWEDQDRSATDQPHV